MLCILVVSLTQTSRLEEVWADEQIAIWTGLARNLDDEGQKIIKNTGTHWKTGDQGAAGTLVAAFDPALNGELVKPRKS